MDVRTLVPALYGDQFGKFGDSWKSQIEVLKLKFGAAIEEVRMPVEHRTDVPIVYVQKDVIVEVLTFIKTQQGFEYNFLADITATDEEIDPRFEIVYNLYSHTHHYRIRIKARVSEGQEIPTAVGVWKAANWAEREIWDMFGVKFKGHPDLRRILMDQRWVGHPLRKDYPLKGYQIFPDPEPIDPQLLD